MTLRKRLDRLEARHSAGGEIPTVTRIIFSAARREGGEIVADATSAMVRAADGWKTIRRDDDEAETDFLARIDAMGDD